MFGLDGQFFTGLVSRFFGMLSGLSTFTQAAIVASIAFLFLAIQTLRSRRALRLPPIKSDKEPNALAKKLGFKAFSGVMQFFSDVSTVFKQSEDLYKTPWILMIGEKHSGTSSLASSLQQSNKFASLLNESPLVRQKQGWWPFDSGMLIDFQGLINRSSRKEVVDEFMALRPERPFDGVVVCISAQDLVDGADSDINARGIALHEQLTQLQQDFAFTFPVYVIVTKSDLLEGFPEFWRAQDKEKFDQRAREIFGWSNPSSLESGYSDKWIEDAFKHMQDALRVEQLRISADGVATDDEEVDNFFLFPTKLQELENPLTRVLTRIFTVNAYQANFFLRGIYFTGKILDDTRGSLVDAVADETPVSFIEMLFSRKIFVERHLARVIREGLWSRQEQIKRLQQLLLGLGVFFAFALFISSMFLSSRVNSIETMLNRVSYESVNSNLRGGQSCTSFEVVSETLGLMGTFDSGVNSTFMPVSWFADSLEDKVFSFLSDKVVKDLLVKAMDCRIKERENLLINRSTLTGNVQTDPINAVAETAKNLESYLQETIALEDILEIWDDFDGVGNGKVKYSKLRELFFAIYGEPIPSDVNKNRSVIVDILERSNVPPYQTGNQVQVAIGNNIRKNIQDLANLTDTALDSGVHLVDQYNQGQVLTADQVGFLASWISWIDKEWLPDSHSDSKTECEQITSMLGAELQQLDSFEDLASTNDKTGFADSLNLNFCRSKARSALAKVTMAPIGNMLVYEAGLSTSDSVGNSGETPATTENNMVVSSDWRKESDKLADLARLGFMDVAGGNFSCDSSAVRWDTTILAQMLARMAELGVYLGVSDVTSLFNNVEKPHEWLAKQHLAQVLDSLATSAQKSSYSTPVYSVQNLSAPTMASLRQGSQDFNASSGRLTEVLKLYLSLGMRDEGTPIAECAQDYAVSQLKALGARANISQVLMPSKNANAETSSSEPLLEFGADNNPDNWWVLALENAKNVVNYSSPYVSFLNNSKDTYGLNGRQTAVTYYWNNSVTQMAESDAGNTSSQVSKLKNLFDDLAGLNAENCVTEVANLPTSALGMDLFSDRRQKYTALAQSFCETEVTSSGSKVYTQLKQDFGPLGSRFPFAAADVSSEASLNDTRDFFLDYAGESDTLKDYLNANQGKVNQPSNQLLINQLNDGVQFFNSHLAVEGTPQALNFSVVFRPDQTTTGNTSEASDGSQDVVVWKLTNGVQTVKRPPGQNSLSWFYGQPLTFSFVWASDGNISPIADPDQPSLSVDETTKTATFAYTGTWALQRILAEHWYTGPTVGSTAPKTVRLKFEVPVKTDSSSKKSKKSKASDESAKTTTSMPNVALYVDLTVSTTNSSGQQAPVFVPQQLPQQFPKIKN